MSRSAKMLRLKVVGLQKSTKWTFAKPIGTKYETLAGQISALSAESAPGEALRRFDFSLNVREKALQAGLE